MKKKLQLNKETMAVLNVKDMSKVVGGLVGECPAENPFGEIILLPDAEDCSVFYKCERGVATQMRCPDGLVFDPEIFACVFPEKSKCKGTLSLIGDCETTRAKSCYMITFCF